MTSGKTSAHASADDAVALHSRIAASFDDNYATSPMFKERVAVWSKLMAAAGSGLSVLDAGCGSGVMTKLALSLGAREALAFDGSAEMIEIARRKLSDEMAQGKVELAVAHLGDSGVLAGRRFQLILCSSVLEYVPDWWASFDWLTGALAPGGTLVFSMPNGKSLYRKFEAVAYGLTGRPAYYKYVRNVPRAADVRRGLAERGLSVTGFHYFGPVPAASAIARPVGAAAYVDTLFVIACRKPIDAGKASDTRR